MCPIYRTIYPDNVTPQQVRTGVILFTDDADDRLACDIGTLTAALQQVVQIQEKERLVQANQEKPDLNEQVICTLSNGYTLRSAGHQYELGAYVRICDEQGKERVYWSADEWSDAPEEVMGSIFGAILHPERFSAILSTQSEQPMLKSKAKNAVLDFFQRIERNFSIHELFIYIMRLAKSKILHLYRENIATHLFDEYSKLALIGHTLRSILFVVETFFQDAPMRTLGTVLCLRATVQHYVEAWKKQIVEWKNELSKEGIVRAGRDALLLTLRYLCPEWVKVRFASDFEATHVSKELREPLELFAGKVDVELTGVAIVRQRRTVVLAEHLTQSEVEELAIETAGDHLWDYQGVQYETIDVTILSYPTERTRQ